MLFPCEPARRLFIGLMPGPDVQAALRLHGRDWGWPAGSWLTRPQRLHLTLHFLGDVGLSREQRLRKALRQLPMQAMELQLGLPQLWQQGIAVLRPNEHDGLRTLRERIGEALPAVGLKPLKAFTPHVTLARAALDAKTPVTHPFIRWPVREFVLVWSRLPPEVRQARYEIVEKFGVNDRRVSYAPSGQVGEQFSLFR